MTGSVWLSSMHSHDRLRAWQRVLATFWLASVVAGCGGARVSDAPPLRDGATPPPVLASASVSASASGSARGQQPDAVRVIAPATGQGALRACIGGWESVSLLEAILATVPPERTLQVLALANQLGPDLLNLERLQCAGIGARAAADQSSGEDCRFAASSVPGFRDAADHGSASAGIAFREVEAYIGTACR